MRLHYKGEYDSNPASLPHGEHVPGAVKFKEAETSKELLITTSILAIAIIIIMTVISVIRLGRFPLNGSIQSILGSFCSVLVLFPHEILHAICFKEDVYLYTNWNQCMMFVVGPETMSKSRFIFMSLLPNIILGIVPYILGMIFPDFTFGLVLGIFAASMGAGDYYNVYNALTQMPKGSRTYLYQFNSYWYMPK